MPAVTLKKILWDFGVVCLNAPKCYILLFCDKKFFVLFISQYPLVKLYCAFIFWQTEFYLFTDKLPCHKTH